MLQKIKSNSWIRLIIYLIAIILVNSVTWLVTSTNQKAGLYPVEADSIGIPIMSTLAASLFVLLILFIISLLSRKGFLIKLKTKGSAPLIALRIGLIVLYAAALLFAIYGIAYWSLPSHYLIAVSYSILSVVLLTGLVIDWRGIDRAN